MSETEAATADKRLIELGWVCFYECTHCKAVGRLLYFAHDKYPGFEVQVKTKHNTFTLWEKNYLISGPHYGYQLRDMLKKFSLISTADESQESQKS